MPIAEKMTRGRKISRKVGHATPVGALQIGRSYRGATRVVVITIQHACGGVPTNLHPLTIKDFACSQSISDWFLLTMTPCPWANCCALLRRCRCN